MATQWFQAINPVFPGTTPPTNKRFKLGTRKRDVSGNEYVYMLGVASNVAGAWVTYNSVSASTAPVLAVADAVGPLAISMAANTSATSASWYLIYGNHSAADVLDNGPAPGASLYMSATTACLDDAAIAGEWVSGAVVTTQAVTSGSIGTAGVFITYPWLNDEAYLT